MSIAPTSFPDRSRRSKNSLLAVFACAAICLAGCQAELYSDLSEDDANQMMAVLMANGIDTEKQAVGKTGFQLSIEKNQILRAVAVLKDAGFPKPKYESVGDAFQPRGLMSSPFEERIRYVYALGEDVAKTLSRIDGVMTARVHIVLPETSDLGQPVKPSSAAVFIKHTPGVDLDYFIPQIKRLVSSSIEGLDYSAVTVVLSEAAPMKTAATTDRRPTIEILPGLSVVQEDQNRFWLWASSVGALIGLLIVSNLTCLFFWRGKSWFKGKSALSLTDSAIEPS